MTARANSHPYLAEEAWFRLAIVETLVGGTLGLVTAVVLVVVSLEVFPSLRDFDHDLGLRMRNAFHERLAHWSYGQVSLNEERPAPPFVFLDVDPEPSLHVQANEAPQAACRALELARKACKADDPATGRERAPQCVGNSEKLDCDRDMRVNRELLASLIAGLRQRRARMILLDVELADASTPAPGSAVLRDVLWSPAGAAVPVIYARPARYDRAANDVHLVRPEVPWGPADASAAPDADAEGGTLSALVLPAPGQPVRRFPRCYQSTGHSDGIVPSLPWLATWVLDHGISQASSACQPGTTEYGKAFEPLNAPAPYIDFAVPLLTEHLDQADDSPEVGRSAVFGSMAVRCLASEFWSSKANCGLARTYEQRVVVIGASNADRRDRHATPIGNMAGAEVLINATRTFYVNPRVADKSLCDALAKKAKIVALSMIPWLIYFSLRGYLHAATRHRGHGDSAANTQAGNAANPSWARRLAVCLGLVISFAATLVAVVVITVQSSIGSFSVLVSVLAVGIEQYVEAAKPALHFCEALFRRMLRLPPEPGGH